MSEPVTHKYMLRFPRCECEKPIIYQLVKDYNLVVNIFRAKVTPEEEGYLVLDVTGKEDDILRALEFVKTFKVTIDNVTKGVTWNPDLCTHCGHCTTHCSTGALRVVNRETREIGFSGEKCIECLACLRVCPFNACSSTF